MNTIKFIFGLCIGALSLYAVELPQALSAQVEKCKNGNAQSCLDVGVALTTGENSENQEKEELGFEYLHRACGYNKIKACNLLGEHYFKDKHFLAAKPYFESACEYNISSACTGLGTMYRDGSDVKQDDVKSRKYYEKSCALGDKDACINVAIIYRGGFGVAKDRNMEKLYYKKACDAGSEAGCSRFTKMDNKDKGIEEPGLWEKFKSLFN
jgi:TPR repeat protein